MIITHVQPNDNLYLQSIARMFNATSRVVTITGACISTNTGIPVGITSLSVHICLTRLLNLSSKNGIYSVSHRSIKSHLSPHQLFYLLALFNPGTRPLFCKNITNIRRISKHAPLTTTHSFILKLHNTGIPIQAYTQNINYLKERVGLCTDIGKGLGSRSHFQKKRRPRFNHQTNQELEAQNNSRSIKYVLLYRSLHHL